MVRMTAVVKSIVVVRNMDPEGRDTKAVFGRVISNGIEVLWALDLCRLPS